MIDRGFLAYSRGVFSTSAFRGIADKVALLCFCMAHVAGAGRCRVVYRNSVPYADVGQNTSINPARPGGGLIPGPCNEALARTQLRPYS